MATDKLATKETVALAAMDPATRIDFGAFAEELGDDVAALGRSLFNRVKIPGGGGRTWEIEDPDSDAPEAVAVIEGIIVAHRAVNAYWAKKDDDGENTPPDCSSPDGRHATGLRPGIDAEVGAHLCGECPLNEFGSAESGGKACKNMHEMYVLRADEPLPLLLVLPPTSITPFKSYIAKSVLLKNRRTHGVITKISLEKMGDGQRAYSRAVFAFGGEVSPEQRDFLASFGAQIAEFTAKEPPMIVAASATVSDDGTPF